MKIESVDFFYLSMPVVRDVGDGSQDALLVRVRSGDCTGWGECEAAPLPSLAAWCCPMSHSACKPVRDSVLGQSLDSPQDIRRIHASVRANSFDLLQADHTLSGIDIALWDLLGRHLEEPVYRLLGFPKAYPKIAYASALFGATPEHTRETARNIAAQGFRAAKFGWGPFGRGTIEADNLQVRAARDGLGDRVRLLVDAGTIWGGNVETAALRLPVLEECRAEWLEEPFRNDAIRAYCDLAKSTRKVPLAAGEGCHNPDQAINLIDLAGIGFVQIDTGRIGGITAAHEVAQHAQKRNVKFVNHTFTTHLALSASLQPYAGFEDHDLCEYPFAPSPLARDFTSTPWLPDESGRIHLPESPGLGIEPNVEELRKYQVPVKIEVGGRTLFESIDLAAS